MKNFKGHFDYRPIRPDTRTFLQVPDPSCPEVKNPYPSDPAQGNLLLPGCVIFQLVCHLCIPLNLLFPFDLNLFSKTPEIWVVACLSQVLRLLQDDRPGGGIESPELLDPLVGHSHQPLHVKVVDGCVINICCLLFNGILGWIVLRINSIVTALLGKSACKLRQDVVDQKHQILRLFHPNFTNYLNHTFAITFFHCIEKLLRDAGKQ